jgi:hypothetical protein
MEFITTEGQFFKEFLKSNELSEYSPSILNSMGHCPGPPWLHHNPVYTIVHVPDYFLKLFSYVTVISYKSDAKPCDHSYIV